MKRIACPLCSTLVAHRDHPGILLNALATAGHDIVSLREMIARLGSSKEDQALLPRYQSRLEAAEARLAELVYFRDSPEESDASLP